MESADRDQIGRYITSSVKNAFMKVTLLCHCNISFANVVLISMGSISY
jgi:hypothetical protein